MRVVSWNVNGLRSVAKKGFGRVRNQNDIDVMCLQETRCLREQLTPGIRSPRGWNTHFVSAERKGYSGVACYSKAKPDEAIAGIGDPTFDIEGRLQFLRFGDLRIVNGYFPNGSGKNRSNSRVPYKLDFYRALYDHLDAAKEAGEPILVLGDFNTAPYDIDLARPKQNRKTSGFLPEESDEVIRWLDNGWTDTFRHIHGDVAEQYSWWSQRFGVREKNIGWRIDLILASPAAIALLKDAFIWPHIQGSDHCPIGVDLDL